MTTIIPEYYTVAKQQTGNTRLTCVRKRIDHVMRSISVSFIGLHHFLIKDGKQSGLRHLRIGANALEFVNINVLVL